MLKIIGIVLLAIVAWTVFCIVLALIRRLWRFAHRRALGDFWEDFWWLWLEAINPLNWL
ncbi:hypothetical protein [Lacticaseibacillus jixiensis]|uniref:hypothetical protein n=1 Tax=Lacticaseibacillus jixiensis TaxID=3231926 RepID=UPI0036F401D6